jgi:hypothetical protein
VSDGFRPRRDGWDGLRRMWQQPKAAPAASNPPDSPDSSPPQGCACRAEVNALTARIMALEARLAAAVAPPAAPVRDAAAATVPQDPLPVVESPPLAPVEPACGGVIPKPSIPAVGEAPRPAVWPAPTRFNPRAALRRMAAAGVPDPLFAALYRAHPLGPPPDVDPSGAGRAVHMPGRG